MEKISSFANRLNELIDKSGKPAIDITDNTGIPKPTISRYRSGQRDPVVSNVKKLAEYFNVSEAYLLGYGASTSEDYYFDPETQALAEKLHNDPQLSMLFDAARNADPKVLKAAYEMIKALKDNEEGNNE